MVTTLNGTEVNAILCKAGEKTLGVEDKNKVEDSQLNSSSFWKSHLSARGRLYNKGGWRADVDDKNQWIQVDLAKKEVVSGIATQGGDFIACWVKTYSVKHSLNGTTFESYKNEGDDKIFDGNSYKETNVLSPPITARYIRIHPVSWSKHICMRIELYGCY
ncbi:lactadherin-like [Dendronephthya gigantea]|uniref:lactadherin-like n=1 Tax=Dendronephthya gigantea TaxID=151771 RepID=UPI0010691BC3|nr:lactadherin-like [Dendronephthya gigantea]